MIFLYIANFLTVLIFLNYGKVINTFFFSKSKKNQVSTNDIISGIIYISFIAIFINFFLPLNIFINDLILIFGIAFFIINIYHKVSLNHLLKLCLIISSISFFNNDF